MSNARNLANLLGTGTQITTADIADGAFQANKNIIINGAMQVAQRGTSSSAGNGFAVDRFTNPVSQSSKLTVQQNAGSVTPPAGFQYYYGMTSSSAYTLISTDYFYVGQNIEGYNVAHLDWGTANAKTVTLSFWVRSSLTGTFGGSIQNNAQDRSYPFSYAISSANTWEYKTVTIAGDTTGTWLKTNGKGAVLWFSVGAGSNNQGTAGAWAAANYASVTGAVDVVGTNGATWYITGVQLEVGSTATPFEHRSFGDELLLCKRYYEKSFPYDVAPSNGPDAGNFATYQGIHWVYESLNSAYHSSYRWDVEKRATPTLTAYGNSSGYWYSPQTNWHQYNSISHQNTVGFLPRQQASGSVIEVFGHYAVDAEL